MANLSYKIQEEYVQKEAEVASTQALGSTAEKLQVDLVEKDKALQASVTKLTDEVAKGQLRAAFGIELSLCGQVEQLEKNLANSKARAEKAEADLIATTEIHRNELEGRVVRAVEDIKAGEEYLQAIEEAKKEGHEESRINAVLAGANAVTAFKESEEFKIRVKKSV